METSLLPSVQKRMVPSATSMSGNRSTSFRPTLTPRGGSRPLDQAPAKTVRNPELFWHCCFRTTHWGGLSHWPQAFHPISIFFSLQDNHQSHVKRPLVHLNGENGLCWSGRSQDSTTALYFLKWFCCCCKYVRQFNRIENDIFILLHNCVQHPSLSSI